MNDLISLEKIAQWQKLKTLVIDSVSSPITKRVYNMALEEFMAWFQQALRLGFTKATVSAWRVSLEDRRLGSSSIIIRMSAIRKLAAEVADNGFVGTGACRRHQSGARSDFGLESHSDSVSGRWNVKTSREQGFGSCPSVNRVMTPVLSYTNGSGSLLLTHFSLAAAYPAD
jgi:hypothetical protein